MWRNKRHTQKTTALQAYSSQVTKCLGFNGMDRTCPYNLSLSERDTNNLSANIACVKKDFLAFFVELSENYGGHAQSPKGTYLRFTKVGATLYEPMDLSVGNASTRSIISIHSNPSSTYWFFGYYPSMSISVHTDFEIDVSTESSHAFVGFLWILMNTDGSYNQRGLKTKS